MLDSDLAELYETPTFRINEAVKRNPERFPQDFVFQLTGAEWESLRSQIATLNKDAPANLISQFAISSHGGRRKPPYAFTEQGVAMLASVLKSQRAAETSIAIMRAFVNMRRFVAKMASAAVEVKELKQMLLLHIDNTNSHLTNHSKKITEIIKVLNLLTEKPEVKRNPIGFVPPSKR